MNTPHKEIDMNINDATNYETDEGNETSPGIEPQPGATPDDFNAGLVLHHAGDHVELHDVELGSADIADVRALAGVALPALPPQISQGWNTEAEKHALGYAIQQGIPASTLQDLWGVYADAVTLFGGLTENDFRTWAQGKLTTAQQDWFVRFHREKVGNRA
jgi:hypothetical protein